LFITTKLTSRQGEFKVKFHKSFPTTLSMKQKHIQFKETKPYKKIEAEYKKGASILRIMSIFYSKISIENSITKSVCDATITIASNKS